MTVLSTRVTFDHVRNTAAGFTAANPVLGYGVTGVETDTGRQKVGDGVTAWSSLTYADAAAIQRANHTGTQPISTVSGLQAALDSKATPADVTAAVSGLVNSAPAALDTLNELAAALGNDANFASTVTTALAAKAPLASPTFTGTVSGVTKGMVGLGNVDNTADASKPVSTAQAAADAAVASAAAADATSKANAAQAAAVQRSNHTGTQAIATVDGLQAAIDAKAAASHVHDAATTSAAGFLSAADKTKLDGIATGATANATDAQLRDRSTHTGTQAASTITGLGGAATLNVGTTAGTVAAGNDARLSDARTPTAGSVTDASITSGGLSTSSLNWAAIQPWAANTAYSKGDLVSNAGIAYRRAVAGVSGATFNVANWQQITPSEFVGSQITSGTVAAARLGTHATTHNPGGSDPITLVEVYEFTRTTKPAAATGSNGSYTFTIPEAAKAVEFYLIGGGGGGGSGRRGAAGSGRFGGGGGASAGVTILTRLASELLSRSLTVAVGAGGAGGAAVTTNDTNGNNGSFGSGSSILFSGNSTFSLNADRGNGGSGGTNAAGAGGSAGGAASSVGSSGGSSSITSNPTGSNVASQLAAAGGGGGGGISTGDVSYSGAIARAQGWMVNVGPSGQVNANGGTAPGGAGQNASDVFTQILGAQPGGAGAGGAAGNATTAGGNGGNGANYGGAGGGGGASFNGYNSGAGGNGGDGFVRITVWY